MTQSIDDINSVLINFPQKRTVYPSRATLVDLRVLMENVLLTFFVFCAVGSCFYFLFLFCFFVSFFLYMLCVVYPIIPLSLVFHSILSLRFYITFIHNVTYLRFFIAILHTTELGPSWSWSYGSSIYYLCNQCLSSLKLWVRIPFMGRCTRYNIIWSSLSVTCDRLVVLS
jgi:hypothetical protein